MSGAAITTAKETSGGRRVKGKDDEADVKSASDRLRRYG